MYPVKIAARAEYGEAGMEWDDKYSDLLLFLLTHLLLVPNPTDTFRCSTLRSSSKGTGQQREGKKFLFCFGRSGGELPNRKFIICMFSLVCGLITL